MKTAYAIKSISIVIFILTLIVAGAVGFYYLYKQTSEEDESVILGEKETVCGDGVCQRITCDEIGCPSPENFLTCPTDCE